MKCPCRDCDRRTITCHGVCKEYQAYSAERAEIAKKNRMETDSRQLSHQQTIKHWRNLKLGRTVSRR